MSRFARLSIVRVIMLAAIWPVLLLIGALSGYLWLTYGQSGPDFYYVAVSGAERSSRLPLVLAALVVVLSPPAVVVGIWLILRRGRDSAT